MACGRLGIVIERLEDPKGRESGGFRPPDGIRRDHRDGSLVRRIADEAVDEIRIILPLSSAPPPNNKSPHQDRRKKYTYNEGSIKTNQLRMHRRLQSKGGDEKVSLSDIIFHEFFERVGQQPP